MESNNVGILLESGTNEVELLRFKVSGQVYAINVIKVSEILKIDNISKVPNSNSAVLGVSLIRGEIITVIDLQSVLEGQPVKSIENKMVLICHFNNMKLAFLVDSIVGIVRKRWLDLQKPDSLTDNSLVIGNVDYNGELLILLDFESIVININPNLQKNIRNISNVEDIDRSKYKIVCVDDSPMIREVLSDTLIDAGCKTMNFFDNGKLAKDYITNLYELHGEDVVNYVDAVITDIEMPILDGHSLTRYIKEHPVLRKIPVVIFSSLITDDLKHKGESVGADGQMSKPEIDKLIGLVDELLRRKVEK